MSRRVPSKGEIRTWYILAAANLLGVIANAIKGEWYDAIAISGFYVIACWIIGDQASQLRQARSIWGKR